MAHIVSDASFATEVMASPIPVLVDFYADWCGPCQMVAPLINKLSTEFEGKVKIVKVNVDDAMETASEYGIQGIPAFKMFAGGKVVEEFTGLKPEAFFREMLTKYANGVPAPQETVPVSDVVHVDDATFSSVVLSSSLPVLVDFYADWCGPCQMMAPVLKKLAKEYEGKYLIAKCNVDASPNMAMHYEVQGIPAFRIFKAGKVVADFAGARPEAQLKSELDAHL